LSVGGGGRGLRVRVVFEAVQGGGRPVRELPEG
jgi:two-component system sensor histidine kinase TctE